jgi:peptidoglycan/LPS O-acetylase OafA/YrhL
MAASETCTPVYFPLQDLVRFLAVIGVVWLHVTYHGALIGWAELGRFAVPFFAGAGVYMAYGHLRRHGHVSMSQYAQVRFRRVYVVFLGWSAIYLGVRWANALLVSHTGTVHTTLIDFFWNGEAFHLWFLPFIFLATIGAFALAKAVHAAPWMRLPLVLILLGLALTITLWIAPDVRSKFGYAALLSYESLPECFIALAVALVEIRFKGPVAEPGLSVPRLVIGGLLVMFWLVGALALGLRENLALTTVAGFGFLLVSLGWSTTERLPVIAHMGSLSFGVYLVHLLFVETIYQLLPRIGLNDQRAMTQLAVFIAALACSIAMVELMRVPKWTRWLLG